MSVTYAYDAKGAFEMVLATLPAIVVKWGEMTYFAGDDGMMWVFDHIGDKPEFAKDVRNAAWFANDLFDGDVPDEFNAAMVAIAGALTTLSAFDPNMEV